jgi:hypothetical protein
MKWAFVILLWLSACLSVGSQRSRRLRYGQRWTPDGRSFRNRPHIRRTLYEPDYWRVQYRYPAEIMKRILPGKEDFDERTFLSEMMHGPNHHWGLERHDFYYILPILLVIGLGAFLIPIITTFFVALISSQGSYCGGRKKRSYQTRDEEKPFLQQRILEVWSLLERAFDSQGKAREKLS